MSAAAEKYESIRILGEGSFGKVYLMRDKVRRALVCVKIIKIRNIPKKEREATRMEVDLLRRLNHPNIVRYMDSFLSRNGDSLCICMEYCDGGDLASQIKSARRNLFSESKILHYFVQLALGLHYMHQNKVLHRDLKTQNVFLLGNGRLVLGDLGISKVLDGTMDFAQTCIGTPYYMSPEIFKNKPYSYKSDVWALGCVLYEMTTLNHAFDAGSLNGLAQKIIKGRFPPIASKYSRHLGDLISSMLNTNPNSRPDLDQILRKPFIKKHILNFFSDVISRPTSNLGEGTMIIRAAVGVRGNTPSALQNDSNMLSLRAQLKDIGLDQQVEDILNPTPREKPRPANPVEVKRMAREQAGALRREEEHKRMIEAALEKLRVEREQRSKDRGGGRYLRAHNKPAVPRQAARGDSSAARDNYLSERERVREKEREQQAAQAAADEERRRKLRIERERKEEADRAEQRRREEVRIEARVREEARLREERKEAERRREVAKNQQLDLLRAKQEAAQRREAHRERERARQREEIEQLKRDKLELDKRAARHEQAMQARAKAEAERNYPPLERTEVQRDEAKDADMMSVFSPSKGGNPNKFFAGAGDGEDDQSNISARDKVMMRKQEKQAKEEHDRIAALRSVEQENRRIRQEASHQRDRQYNSKQVETAVAQRQEPQASARSQARGGNGAGAMELDELTERLREATKDARPQARFGVREEANPPAYPGPGNDRYNVGDTDSDEDLWGGKKDEQDNDSSEEEDIAAREEELQSQLAMATTRCETLKKNLQETVSFATSFNTQQANGALVGKKPAAGAGPGGKEVISGGHIGRIAEKVASSLSDDIDPEDDDLYDGSESDEEEVYQVQNHEGLGLGLDAAAGNNVQRPSLDSEDSTPRKGAKPSLAVKVSPYIGLHDAPSPSGKLGERIERLRQRCIEALGRVSFNDAYQYLQDIDDVQQMDEAFEIEKKRRMRSILGDDKAHYAPLIEQLLFMELSHCG